MLRKITKVLHIGNGVLVSLVTVLFLVSYLLSLATATTMTNQMSEGCPFMDHAEVVCSASPLGHIAEWQSVFISVLPTQILTVAMFGAVLYVLRSFVPTQCLLRAQIAVKVRTLLRSIAIQLKTFFYRPWQALFAQGLLHPKTF